MYHLQQEEDGHSQPSRPGRELSRGSTSGKHSSSPDSANSGFSPCCASLLWPHRQSQDTVWSWLLLFLLSWHLRAGWTLPAGEFSFKAPSQQPQHPRIAAQMTSWLSPDGCVQENWQSKLMQKYKKSEEKYSRLPQLAFRSVNTCLMHPWTCQEGCKGDVNDPGRKNMVVENELCSQHAHQKLVTELGGFARSHPILASTHPSTCRTGLVLAADTPAGWGVLPYLMMLSLPPHPFTAQTQQDIAAWSSRGDSFLPFLSSPSLLPLVAITSGTEGEGCHQCDATFWFWD